MTFGALAFIGYAIKRFFAHSDFTDSYRARHRPGRGERREDRDRGVQPLLYHYIGHLHIAVSGFIAATGLAVATLAWFGVRQGYVWAWVAAVAAPVLGLAVALPAHYPYGFDTIGHLGLIYLATAIFVVGVALSGKALLDEQRHA